MKITLIALACAVLCTCGKDSPSKSGPARLEVTYTDDSDDHLIVLCRECSGSHKQHGHGTVKNVGGSDAYNVYVEIHAACETFYMPVFPLALAPGQFGSYITGEFCDNGNPLISPGFSEAP